MQSQKIIWENQSELYAKFHSTSDLPKKYFDLLLNNNSGLIIDIGSGNGSYLPFLTGKGNKVVAVDLSYSLLSKIKRDPFVYLVQADASALPFRGGVFSGAFSFSVLPCVPYEKWNDFFKETARILSKESSFILVVSNIWSFFTPLRVFMIWIGKYTFGAIVHTTISNVKSFVDRSGFVITQYQTLYKPPTGTSKLRLCGSYIAAAVDEVIKKVFRLWGSDLLVMLKKRR